MAFIGVNLKRFDVPRKLGGICQKENPREWIRWVITRSVENGLGRLEGFNIVYLLPEALILDAREALEGFPADETRSIRIGSQGVFREDVRPGGNFGAFTTNLPAAAVRNMGCTWSIIGHSEERRDKLGIMAAYDPQLSTNNGSRAASSQAVNTLINREVVCAIEAGLNVLLCEG